MRVRESSSLQLSYSRRYLLEPATGPTNEHIFQRRLMDADGINLTGERLNQFGNEFMAVGAFDAHAAIQDPRLDAKPLAHLFRQTLRLPGFHRNHVTANLFLQFARRTQGHELAAV